MRLHLLAYGLLAYATSLVSATALTYKLSPNEKACFFAYVEEKGSKLAFYFAVCRKGPHTYSLLGLYMARPSHLLLLTPSFTAQVQSGGSFDIDYSVIGPNEKIIMDNQKERQGDFVFSATDAGEYRFCFNNEMSTFAEKTVDFEITVGIPIPPSPIPASQTPQTTTTATHD